jgi:hypothetical protein
MITAKIIQERKQQAKVVAIVVFTILMMILFVGSWRAKVRVANERIDVSWANLSSSLERRQDVFVDIIRYIQKKTPQEKKLLNTIIQSYHSLPQVVADKKILQDVAASQNFITPYLALSTLTPKVAQYSWQKTVLSGDKQYYRKLKNLYVTTYQIKSTQAILNQDVGFYNKSLRGLSGTVLNILFRYPKKLKLEDMVGEQISIDEFMGVSPRHKT